MPTTHDAEVKPYRPWDGKIEVTDASTVRYAITCPTPALNTLPALRRHGCEEIHEMHKMAKNKVYNMGDKMAAELLLMLGLWLVDNTGGKSDDE
jgi:hypothetical protein